MAFLSGSYAFYTVFSPKDTEVLEASTHMPSVVASILAGMVWALVIFNIERFIVSSTGKGDGTDAITGKEFLQSLPRIIMRCIIAISLSKPLEIRIMEAEINAAIQAEQGELILEMSERIKGESSDRRDELITKIETLKKKLDAQDEVLENRRKEINSQRKAVELEIEGKSGSGKAGMGPAARRKLQNLSDLEEELERDSQKLEKRQVVYLEEIKTLEKEKNSIDETSDNRISSERHVIHQSGGLVQRIKLAHEVSPGISIAITLLLLMIEIGPIFFKMMVRKSAYDYLQQNQEMLTKARAGIEVMSDMVQAPDGSILTEHVHDKFIHVENEIKERKRRLATENLLSEKMHFAYRQQMEEKVIQDSTTNMSWEEYSNDKF